MEVTNLVAVAVSRRFGVCPQIKAPAYMAFTVETDVKMRDAPVTENGAQETGDNPVQMEADVKVEAPKKKIKKKTNIPVSEMVYGAMLPAESSGKGV
ncbi:hypothetical protein L1987_86809 [Smallanthus sonchifolius]|uniref:Uncharacterized protein n=1 Tax=Smallanthus sonchifolius TaxID=185202 RepID=A0ACB8Y0C8_9ASTR|nr:hypothetical protein L1987_86809 [Smallanthus sonchifolius]